MSDQVTQRSCPIILVRGFGGLSVEDERQVAYQGFNDGTVYPHKRGENYVYEGFVLRLMKSDWKYNDATNVVGFFSKPVGPVPIDQSRFLGLNPEFFQNSDVVIDPYMAERLLNSEADPTKSFWVFRYYDLGGRRIELFARALVRLIEFIRALIAIKKPGSPVKVNIVAHSMGGLIVREAIQKIYPSKESPKEAANHINKIVTLGTPHKGIAFQVFERWALLEAAPELEAFYPGNPSGETPPSHWTKFKDCFPIERLLCVVGTNYRTYSVRSASVLNRIFSADGEFGPTYNRSDGLVKQAYAQIDGAPRTFVHKCHGGPDSLVTSREAFEIATRFFFGDVRVRARLLRAEIKGGKDYFGGSEFFFGVTIKARGVDFELFHQSAEAENCYGPFATAKMEEDDPPFDWAGPDRLIWEGWLMTPASRGDGDLVLRADFYVGERDSFGVGFSDNVVFRKQYYLRAIMKPFEIRLYTAEDFDRPRKGREKYQTAEPTANGWKVSIKGTGFNADIGLELDLIPEDGPPKPLRSSDLGGFDPSRPT
jgi:pimeloyl-ACP methyl ester carboxylesterase